MKTITQKEIEKLTVPLRRGRKVKSQSLYEDIKSLKIGETKFMSKEEWESFGYKIKSFSAWWASTKRQTRKGHKGQLTDIDLEIVLFEEGRTIKRLK